MEFGKGNLYTIGPDGKEKLIGTNARLWIGERTIMPQGPAHLHRRFGDDWTAWTYLKRRGFTQSRFIIRPPVRGYTLTNDEADAIDYLWLEWDWSYAPSCAPETLPARSMLQSWGRWVLRALSGPLRVRDKHLRAFQMWWYCSAKYELRKRWYYVTGRRKLWDGCCFSCGGLNLSCPDGCGRDSVTGELDGSTL